MRIHVVNLIAVVLLAWTASEARALETATVSGFVFKDLSGDGVRQGGEPGLGDRTVKLGVVGQTARTATTDSIGAYQFTGVADGEYDIAVELDITGPVLCTDSFGGFNPLRIDDCHGIGKSYYTPTSVESTEVTVAGADVVVDFGGKPRTGLRDIYGVAILRDSYAPVGTTIEAVFNGNACGAGQVAELGGSGNYTFDLTVYGDAERPGCPHEGEALAFVVGGVQASETFAWGGFFGHVLTAAPDHAWFWVEKQLPSSPVQGVFVQARIGNTTCGEAEIRKEFRLTDPVFGFSRLIVPSAALVAGCGGPGTTVTFRLGNESVSAKWQPGIQALDLPLERAILVVDGPAKFPDTGGRPRPPLSTANDVGYVAGRLTFFVLIGGVAAFVIWRMTRRRKVGN